VVRILHAVRNFGFADLHIGLIAQGQTSEIHAICESPISKLGHLNAIGWKPVFNVVASGFNRKSSLSGAKKPGSVPV